MVSDARFLGTFLKKNHVSDSGNLLPLDEHMQTEKIPRHGLVETQKDQEFFNNLEILTVCLYL